MNPWPGYTLPAPGPARSIGNYSSGCLQGAEELPLDGMGYQVMKPSRRRYYGHPQLIEYVRHLGKTVHKQRLGVLLVGDLSQPRGGRAASGHASHQTGLDVDVWYSFPDRARAAPLPMLLREKLTMESILDAKRDAMLGSWKRHAARVLKLAVADERVDRVFVHPVIKRTLCESQEERGWLRKIRPWHGHDDHFHVRLGCSAEDLECQAQPALPEGDGCDKLSSWFKRKAPVAKVRRKVGRLPSAAPAVVEPPRPWPAQCDALLTPVDERIALPTM